MASRPDHGRGKDREPPSPDHGYCLDCGATVAQPQGFSGQPRIICDACRARR